MSSSVFSEQILADKLSKLNTTQQCIATLSHWCIFHRSKAELVVTTWDKQFHDSNMFQKVPLLYLANDVLQNSKRKGNEFVTRFWKVLPAALKDVQDKGDDHGKNVVSRLVDIWQERRVFGSRVRNLKEVMLGEEVPPPLELSGKKCSRSVKILKRDSRFIRTKLSIGGTAEKIVSAFHTMLGEHTNEDAEIGKCKSAVHHVRKLERDVHVVYTNVKDPKRKVLAKELEEEENILKQCIEKLKMVEASRVALVSQLREALNEQESKLENVRTHMQVAQAQAEEASNMRKLMNDEDYVTKPSIVSIPSIDANVKGQMLKKSSADIAAEVADKLAPSSSSQLIMSSVLSTFAAEEARSVSLTKACTLSSSSMSAAMILGMDSMSKSEKSLSVLDPDVFISPQLPTSAPSNHSCQSVLVPQPTLQNQAPTSQAQYHLLSNPTSQQYFQASGGVMVPYGYGSNPALPSGPPQPPPYMVSPMAPLAQQPLQLAQQQPMSLAQQSASITQQTIPLTQQPQAVLSFQPLQPPGMVYHSSQHPSGYN